MKFMVSLITDGNLMQRATPEEIAEMGANMSRFMEEIQEAGVLQHTDALGPPAEAKTLRYGEEGRAVVTDGPFAETKEQVAGYMVLECSDLDEAFGWAERLPVLGGSIEVRPIAERPGGP
jgi:hypothetical protein